MPYAKMNKISMAQDGTQSYKSLKMYGSDLYHQSLRLSMLMAEVPIP